jgi:hypothetical protein
MIRSQIVVQFDFDAMPASRGSASAHAAYLAKPAITRSNRELTAKLEAGIA